MVSLVSLIQSFENFWKDAVVANISKKMFFPQLAELSQIPLNTLIFNYDKINVESMNYSLNDQIQLLINVDAIVPLGKTFETLDSILTILKTNNNLNRAVLRTEIEDIDLNNPDNKMEGFTIRMRIFK